MLLRKHEAPGEDFCNNLQVKRPRNHRRLPRTIHCWPTTLPPPTPHIPWIPGQVSEGILLTRKKNGEYTSIHAILYISVSKFIQNNKQ